MILNVNNFLLVWIGSCTKFKEVHSKVVINEACISGTISSNALMHYLFSQIEMFYDLFNLFVRKLLFNLREVGIS